MSGSARPPNANAPPPRAGDSSRSGGGRLASPQPRIARDGSRPRSASPSRQGANVKEQNDALMVHDPWSEARGKRDHHTVLGIKLVHVALVMFLLIYLQDFITDVSLIHQYYMQSWKERTIALTICVLAPGFAVAISHFQKQLWIKGLLSILTLSFYIAFFDCMDAGIITPEFKIERISNTLFGNVPQFIFQAYVLFSNHFNSQTCERAFDHVCALQCGSGLPPSVNASEFSRGTCVALDMGKGSDEERRECWDLYMHCISKCAAFEHVSDKVSAEKELVEALPLRTTEGYALVKRARSQLSKVTKNLERTMHEDSELWVQTGCFAGAAAWMQVFPNPALMPEGMDDEKRHFHTFKVDILYLWGEIFAIVFTGITVAGSLTLFVMEEREFGKDSVPIKVRSALSVFFHILFDMTASIFSATCLLSSFRNIASRAYLLSFGIVVYYCAFQTSPTHKRRPRLARLACACFHSILSPIVRMPHAPNMQSRFITRLLCMRALFQIIASGLGFAKLSLSDPGGFAGWYMTASLTFFIISAAFLCSFLKGPDTMWSEAWDEQNRRRTYLALCRRRPRWFIREWSATATALRNARGVQRKGLLSRFRKKRATAADTTNNAVDDDGAVLDTPDAVVATRSIVPDIADAVGARGVVNATAETTSAAVKTTSAVVETTSAVVETTSAEMPNTTTVATVAGDAADEVALMAGSAGDAVGVEDVDKDADALFGLFSWNNNFVNYIYEDGPTVEPRTLTLSDDEGEEHDTAGGENPGGGSRPDSGEPPGASSSQPAPAPAAEPLLLQQDAAEDDDVGVGEGKVPPKKRSSRKAN